MEWNTACTVLRSRVKCVPQTVIKHIVHGVDNAHSVSHFRLVCIDWDVAIIIVQASTTTAVSVFANCKRFPKAQVNVDSLYM